MSDLILGLLLLMASAVAATIHLSLRQAGDAGIQRFLEKYPSANRFRFWTRRWPSLCSAVLLLVGGLVIAALLSLIGWGSAAVSSWDLFLRGLAVLLMTLFAVHVLPIALAESFSDRIAIVFLPGIIIWSTAVLPLAIGLSAVEDHLTRLFRSQSEDSNRPTSEDEIISVVDDTDSDDLEETQREMIRSVLEFGETFTREIMTHRVDINAFEHTATVSACIERAKQGTHSRYPVYAGSLDDVRGIVHVKDLLRLLSEGNANEQVGSLCNKVTFVPESMPIDDLFRLMRAQHAHLVLVVDEYGGTAGLVTMEDIIEELVGEIQDEYDTAEVKIQELSDGSYLVDAREPVHEINEALKIQIPEHDDYDSLGGFIFHQLGSIPTPGEIIEIAGLEICVHTAVPNRVINAKIVKKTTESG